MNAPVHVDLQSFEKTVIQSKIPVLVDFWAPWCAPCRMIAPHLDALAQEYEDKLLVVKLNTDENPDLSVKYQVSGIPTLMIFQNGGIVERITGAVPKEFIKEKLAQYLV